MSNCRCLDRLLTWWVHSFRVVLSSPSMEHSRTTAAAHVKNRVIFCEKSSFLSFKNHSKIFLKLFIPFSLFFFLRCIALIFSFETSCACWVPRRSPHRSEMAGTGVATRLAQSAVKPLISNSNAEARRRVRKLYKAWYRQIPFVCKFYLLYVHRSCSRSYMYM